MMQTLILHLGSQSLAARLVNYYRDPTSGVFPAEGFGDRVKQRFPCTTAYLHWLCECCYKGVNIAAPCRRRSSFPAAPLGATTGGGYSR